MNDLIDRQAAIEALKPCAGVGNRALDKLRALPTVEPHWIPCTERMPEENNWLGGSRRKFSDEVLVSVVNYDDDEILTHISQTIEGKWALNFASRCKVIAWMPLPKPYEEGMEADGTD